MDFAANNLASYDRASRALLALIRGKRHVSRTPAGRRRRAEAKLARTRRLLSALGNPHRQYAVIHVTGTSGKGSTCALIAGILTAAGYRVGLRTSPYLQVQTEKLQVSASLIDGVSFDRTVAEVLSVGHDLYQDQHDHERLGYAEVWTAVALTWFAQRRVDVAVVEVGAGGRFDATNVVEPAVSVITSVGADHIVSFGPTIADIAWHKAGIIKPGSVAVVGKLPAAAWEVVREAAASAAVPVRRPAVFGQELYRDLSMTGAFQRANAGVAVAAARALAELGFGLPEAAIDAGLQAARLPGRLERMPVPGGVPAVWIDGAHNPDKMAALAAEVRATADDEPLPVVVLGVLATKDIPAMLSSLLPLASAIVATEPAVIGKRSQSAAALGAAARDAGFGGRVAIEPDVAAAIQCAETLARARGSRVLITGSIYLAGQARRRWYPDAEIVVQRTPWPRVARAGGSGAS